MEKWVLSIDVGKLIINRTRLKFNFMTKRLSLILMLLLNCTRKLIFMNTKLFTLLVLLLCRVVNVYSQEWEYSLDYYADDDKRFSFVEVKELSNGNICVASIEYYRSGAGDFYSCHPAVSLFSPNFKTASYVLS